MNYIGILGLLRSIAYGMVAVEAFILAFLYYFGYENLKHTPIIKSIVYFFFSLGLFFVFATYNTAADFFNFEAHQIIKNVGFIFVVPLILSLINFRKISLDDSNLDSKKIEAVIVKTKTNTKNIKTNTSDIVVNTDDIYTNSNRLDVLEEEVKK